MKLQLFIASICLNILFLFMLFFFPTLGAQSKPEEQSKPNYKVAIVTPATHPSLIQIEHGFKETLSRDSRANFEFKTYNAQGNKALMRSEIDHIQREGYDLIFTIGAQSSIMTKEVFNKKDDLTPIIFAAVSNPDSLGLLSQGQVTGAIEITDFERELHLLTYLKPDVKRLLLVYDPSQGAGLTREKEFVEEITKKMGIHLQLAEIFALNEIVPKVSAKISDADAVMVLKDNTIVSGLDALIKICNRKKVPLLATDLDSVDRGAAFGFGVYEYDYGVEGGKKAKQILVDKIPAAQIPATPVDHFLLRVNEEALVSQGVHIEPEILFFIKSGER